MAKKFENYHESKQNTFPVIWYLKYNSSRTQTPYVFKIAYHNILFNFLKSPKNNQYQIPPCHKNAL